jgi:KDO2-lipid IV(A) lauroyltransferase
MDPENNGPESVRESTATRRARLQVLAMRLAHEVAPRLPRGPSLSAAKAVGSLAALVSPGRHAVAANMRQVLGPNATPAAVRSAVRSAFRVQAQNYVDLFRMTESTRDELPRILRYANTDRLASALAGGRGAILVSGHVGNLDLVALHIGQMAHRTTAVIERLHPPELMDFVTGLRACTGVHFVPVDHAAMALLKALRRGDLVYVAADLNLSGSAISVPLFGAETVLPDAYARLARRYGVPIFFGTAARRADGSIDAGCDLVGLPEFTENAEADVRKIVEAVVGRLEDSIRADPGQWIMFRAVWPSTGTP